LTEPTVFDTTFSKSVPSDFTSFMRKSKRTEFKSV
jgi:hypothetical protein